MINVKFQVIEFEAQVQIISEFLRLNNENSIFIAKTLGLNTNDQPEVIRQKILVQYSELLPKLNEKRPAFQQIWNKHKKFINNEFKNIFSKEFCFNCTARVNINPSSPRFLENHSFDVDVMSSDKYLLSTCIHEILHFAWFELWKQNFPNIPQTEYEYPHPSWLISEIALEPLFRFSKLKNLITNKFFAYKYFYHEKINNQTISSIANKIFSESENILEFQQKMFDYFYNNPKSKKLIK